jgi:hypothetical protein
MDNDPRSLHDRQVLHVRLTAKLIEWAAAQGLELTWGETYRLPAQAQANAASGAGIANSLHIQRLAVDFQLFKGGVYITDAAAYKPLADYWLTLDPLCRAGYYFHTVDADHFSVTYKGVS